MISASFILAMAAVATQPRCTPPPPGDVPRIQAIPWTKLPSPGDLERVYPKPALKAGLTGRASIMCRAGARGEMLDCHVRSEAPEGQGFGEAALKLTERFRVAQVTANCTPTAGAAIPINIRFRMGGAPEKPPVSFPDRSDDL